MKTTTRSIVLFLVLLATPYIAQTQEHPNVARGLNPHATLAFGEIDSISKFNGNLSLAFPIGGRYPVNAELSYGLTLTYNSNVWDYVDTDNEIRVHPALRSNAGMGWLLSLGRVIPPNDPDSTSDARVYESPDSAVHALYPTLHDGDPADAYEYSRNGSYLRFNPLIGLPPENWGIEFPDGLIQQFDSDGTLHKIRDQFGNYVNLSHLEGPSGDPIRTTITDQHGRVHYIYFVRLLEQYENSAVTVVDYVDLQTFGGARAIYQFEYEQREIQRGCGFDGDLQDPTQWVALLKEVVLPDGITKYAMPFNTIEENSSYHYQSCTTSGRLRRLRLPTLAYIQWTYGAYLFPDPDGPPSEAKFTKNWGVQNRTILDASGVPGEQWTFNPFIESGPNPIEARTEVTYPTGHKTTHYFFVGMQDVDYGRPYTRHVEASPGSGRYLSAQVKKANDSLVRSTFVAFERDVGDSTDPNDGEFGGSIYDLNFRVKATRTVFHDDSDVYADSCFSSFDGLGHYRHTDTSGTFGSGNVKNLTMNYNEGNGIYIGAHNAPSGAVCGSQVHSYIPPALGAPWVLNTFVGDPVTENVVTNRNKYCFDANTGFLKRKRIQQTFAESDNLLTVLTSDPSGTGNVVREDYYGGDLQAITATSDLCNDPLPAQPSFSIVHGYSYGVKNSSQFLDPATGQPLSFKSLDQDIDWSTGLVSRSRDQAGLATDFSYDAMGRLTEVEPTFGHGTWQFVTYTPAVSSPWQPTKIATRHYEMTPFGPGTLMAETEQWFGGLGRLTRERRNTPQGWVARTIQYNSMGWKTGISEFETVQPNVNYTTFSSFDPFGRPGEIRRPDNSLTTLIYTGSRVVQRTSQVRTGGTGSTLVQTPSTWREEYDRQGRLWKVTEPAVPPATALTTQYRYDPRNNLIEVSNDTQLRTFTYDRGLLVSETQPEISGVIEYKEYDALGNVGRRILGAPGGPFDLRYLYDRAGRLVEAREYSTGGNGRKWKEFVYATSNGVNDYRNGKLFQAIRHNHHDFYGIDFIVTETYKYGGRGGRISQRDTTTNYNVAFTQSFAYDDLGQTAALTYPSCVHVSCPGSGSSVTPTYSLGHLQSVPGYASQITYHPSGLVNQLTFASNAFWNQSADGNGMARPAQIAVSNTNVNWSTGTYLYDGSGNIATTGSDYYLYDPLSRVKSGVFGARREDYGFDVFGNITSMATDGGPPRLFPTNPASNRLEPPASYDSAGNLTSWSGSTNAYDPFNMQLSAVAAGRHWSFVYTADDERIWSYDGLANTSQWKVRDLDGNVLTEFRTVNPGGGDIWSWNRDYIYRGSTLLARKDSAQGTWFFGNDHLGTPRHISDINRNRVEEHHYYPFGAEYTAPGGDALKFTGHERDFPTAPYIDYMHARFYDSGLGRFLSVDPIGGNPRSPQSWNKYSYVLDNPIKYIDPLGLSPRSGFCDGCFEDAVDEFERFKAASLARSRLLFNRRATFALAGWLWQTSPHNPDNVDRVLDNANREFDYQFEQSVANDDPLLAGLNFVIDELFLPESQAELGVMMATAFVPPIRALAFTPDQQALIQLAKVAQQTGVTREQAVILLRWGREVAKGRVDFPVLSHTSPQRAAHWVLGPHIRIGPVKHILVK